MNQDFDEQLDAVSRTARRIAAASAGSSPHQVVAAFGDAGLLGAIASEEVGGLALPLSFAAAIVSASARELFADNIAETLVAARVVAEMAPDIARALASGQALATVALQEGLEATRAAGGYAVTGAVASVVMADQARYLLAPVSLEGTQDAALVLIDLHAHGVRCEPAETLELERSRAHVHVSGLVLPASQVLVGRMPVLAMRGSMQFLNAHALLAQADACLARTCEHVSTRRQFGERLAALQSVRFALAQCALETRNTGHLLDGVACGDHVDTLQAAMAYSHAAAHCPAIVEQCIHLHGGIGYTWEMPLHRYLRRMRAMTDQAAADGACDQIAYLLFDQSGDGAQHGLSGIA